MDKLRDFIRDFWLNLNPGMVCFVAQRVTGLALLLYLFLHILTLSPARAGADAFNQSVAKFDNLKGHVLEYLLLLAVAAHLLNGLRVILVDLCGLSLAHKRLAWLAAAFLLVTALYGLRILL